MEQAALLINLKYKMLTVQHGQGEAAIILLAWILFLASRLDGNIAVYECRPPSRRHAVVISVWLYVRRPAAVLLRESTSKLFLNC
jgi:hypothetical protein